MRAHVLLTLGSARVSQPLIEDRFVQMVPLYVEGLYEGVFDLLAVWLRSDSQGWTTMADLMGNDVARREEATLLRKDKCSTFQNKLKT